jgi:hypothetical protein
LKLAQVLPIILLSAIAGAAPCRAQTITVHLINGKNGKPYTHEMLRTSLFNGKIKGVSLDGANGIASPTNRSPGSFMSPGWRNGGLSAPLDARGIATFHLPDPPLPPVVCALPDIPPGTTMVCGKACFPTKLVLHAGVVAGNWCEGKKKIRAQFKPKPGEIILFVRRHTFWDSPPWE